MRKHNIRLFVVVTVALAILLPGPAHSIGFLCEFYEDFKAWQEKREQLQEDVLDPDSGLTPEEFEDTKQELDEEIEDIAEDLIEDLGEAPGTSLTGPPSATDLLELGLEALKELVGSIFFSEHQAFPDLERSAVAPRGAFAATPVYTSIPVEADDGDVELEYSYIFSEADGAPMLVLRGSIRGLEVGPFTVYSNLEGSDAAGGLPVTPQDIARLLATNPSYGTGAFVRGLFSEAMLDWVSEQEYSFDPGGSLRPGIEQASILELEVESSGAASIEFVSLAADLPPTTERAEREASPLSLSLYLGNYSPDLEILDNELTWGVRGDYRLRDSFGLAGTLGCYDTEVGPVDFEANFADLSFVWFPNPGGPAELQVYGGPGWAFLDAAAELTRVSEDSLTAHLGLGLEFDLGERFFLRPDIKARWFERANDLVDLEFTLALGLRFLSGLGRGSCGGFHICEACGQGCVGTKARECVALNCAFNITYPDAPDLTRCIVWCVDP